MFYSKHIFWTLARQYPDIAQAWFEEGDDWRIFLGEPAGGYQSSVPEADWAGPFYIWVRDKATGQQRRAVVFGKHASLFASQAHFPHFIASIIGEYPKPRRIPMNWILGCLASISLAIWMLSASDLDRWVIRDGAVACTDEEDARRIQRASTASHRRSLTEDAVEQRECVVLLADERVRIAHLSTDGSRTLVYTKKLSGPRWMATNDLRKTSPSWIVIPWIVFDRGTPKKDAEVRADQAVVLKFYEEPLSDPTPMIEVGVCIDWKHAVKYGYVDDCWKRARKDWNLEPSDANP